MRRRTENRQQTQTKPTEQKAAQGCICLIFSQKMPRSYVFGKEDIVKETQEGCLSRTITPPRGQVCGANLPPNRKPPTFVGGFLFGGEWRTRPPAGGPGRGSDVPPARHSLPLPSSPHGSLCQTKQAAQRAACFVWWRVADSNRRPSACEADALTS